MNPFIRRFGAVVAIALISAAIGNVGASAQDSHPSTDKCIPTKFFTPTAGSAVVFVDQPLPAQVVGVHGRNSLILLRNLPAVGDPISAEVRVTDGNPDPLVKSLSKNVSSEQLCLIIVGTWKIERAGEGEITITTTPASQNAQPQTKTIKFVIK